jgi:predicted AlkP superfamily pyrophosphatase or phosphodiesterase
MTTSANNYRISINSNDKLTGEFTGGKEYFETEAEAVIIFKKYVKEELNLNENVSIYLIDNNDGEVLASFDTTGL